MENIIILIGTIIIVHFVWIKTKGLFRKNPKKTSQKIVKSEANNVRDQAISKLMNNLQKAKSNRPEIIEENPKLAAKVLKMWAKDRK